MPNKLIDIDNEFEDVQDFFDEKAIAVRTAVKNRDHKKWYEANSERFNDPDYLKRLSESLKNSPRVKEANKKKGADLEFRKAVSEGGKRYASSPDYVHPKGMLGKKRSEESIEKQRQKVLGVPKSSEHNHRVSLARQGLKPKQESIEKMRQKLLGRETGRSRRVLTPAGEFNKLKEAADYYEVSTGSIKNFIAGQNVKEWFKPHLEAKGVKFNSLTPLGFSWLGDKQKELGPKPVHTPWGNFINISEAAKAKGLSTASIRSNIKKYPDKYYYIKD